ncbi:glycosyltransferase involved in cell wall biosynthesis [Lipingzhangella halophila]|uniref:Glycosyltransferase involved in cell wall biosynthesis n=1 Tax=Lipingzhangella halophila TaxID=1783352 RepID=A0A7W7RL03_9ACTN|nr:glycosyltransferase family 4 protein [Lipingzhangella halophila]MBB4933917.1 glycosyltransferase involved in cell wall biosynthesis [Lipingzhangella halophila]
MKITILIANAYGMGGTIRTVFNLAGGLAERHQVEIVSLVRHTEKPFFAVPDGVELKALTWIGPYAEAHDNPSRIDEWRERRPASPVPPSEFRRNRYLNVRTERVVRKLLRRTDADVVMGTRPGINLLISRWAPRRVLTIGQVHTHLGSHAADLRTAMRKRYPRLDGLTVLTESDRDKFMDFLGPPPGWLVSMPNALPPGEYPQSSQENPIMVAAGRIAAVKQYPKLLKAFSMVASVHPEWRLRIYAGGEGQDDLRTQIADMGLSNQVTLMGRTRDLPGELSKGSLLAVSSRYEGFGMTIIEAFSVGVPVVSFDCPQGPREIIEHERNGLLVPAQEVTSLGWALLRMVENHEERQRMSEAALRSSEAYALPVITRRWEEYIEERKASKAAR